MSSQNHPLRKILNEFTKSFLYMNRHVLYTDKEVERPDGESDYDSTPKVNIFKDESTKGDMVFVKKKQEGLRRKLSNSVRIDQSNKKGTHD